MIDNKTILKLATMKPEQAIKAMLMMGYKWDLPLNKKQE